MHFESLTGNLNSMCLHVRDAAFARRCVQRKALLMPTPDVTTETQAYAAAKASGTLVVSCADCAKKRGLTVPCLHSLDFSRLVDAVAKGVSTIELVRGNCDKCPKCIPGTSLIDTCQTLEAFAGQFEKTLSVVLETSTKDVDLSRRRFFGGLLRRADIGTKPASPDVVADVKATATETSQRLPASRERLVEALRTATRKHLTPLAQHAFLLLLSLSRQPVRPAGFARKSVQPKHSQWKQVKRRCFLKPSKRIALAVGCVVTFAIVTQSQSRP